MLTQQQNHDQQQQNHSQITPINLKHNTALILQQHKHTHTTMSKDCGHQDDDDRHQRRVRAAILCSIGFVFLGLVFFVFPLIWFVVRPTEPRFILQDAILYTFDLSTTAEPTPNTLITTTMQVNLSSFNPHKHIGIYYTEIDVYASYRGQRISQATELPASYQGHHDRMVWLPFLNGTSVPVSPDLLGFLQRDTAEGVLVIDVEVNGRVKWKVGTWVSWRFDVYADCPVYISLPTADRDNAVGVAAAAPKEMMLPSLGVKLQMRSCTDDDVDLFK